MERVESMDFIVLNLGHAKTTHAWGNRDHSSPFVRLYYVKKGRAVLHLPQGDFEVTEGHMYLIQSYVPHSYECDPGFEFFYMFLFQRRYDTVNIFDQYDFPLEVKSNDATRLLFEGYCNLYPQLNLPFLSAEDFDNHPTFHAYAQAYMNMADYERLQLHGLVEIIVSYFVKHSTPQLFTKDERLSKVIKYIAENVQKPLSVEELADIACLTPSYLIRSFKKSFGITPLQYIIKKKIQHAQKLLLSTELPIQTIAAMAGFDDASYFIRLFKKNIGLTPQIYRENLIG